MSNKYDPEERTFIFAKAVINYVNSLKKTLANVEIARQVIRSSGSTGANYIEANESLSKKDFIYRIKLCRKEAKESTFWLKLLQDRNGSSQERKNLIQESIELTKIFGSILRNSTQK